MNSSDTYFEIFKILPRFFIDTDKIQKEFYVLSRSLHPDRFHGKAGFEEATLDFALINKALNTLKVSNDRAEYLFKLAQFKPQKSKTSLPPALAEEYFELQEALEDSQLNSVEKKSRLKGFSEHIAAQEKEADLARDRAFKEWEEAGAPLDQKAFPFFERAAFEISQKSFLESMANDLKKKLGI